MCTWNSTEVVICTTTNAPKLASLRRNLAVALTIDTEVHPPKILLLRGEAVLDGVDVPNACCTPTTPNIIRSPPASRTTP